MFSPSHSKVTAVCVAMVMMMMMAMKTEAAAMPKGGGHLKHKTHKKSSDGVAVETVPLQLDPKALVHTGIIRPLENSSISPWTYNVTHDESLYPPQLSEARCLLTGCLNRGGEEDLSLESRPILRQVLVLRRVRSAGEDQNYHFRLESRLIAVGCTCVRPIIRHQH